MKKITLFITAFALIALGSGPTYATDNTGGAGAATFAPTESDIQRQQGLAAIRGKLSEANALWQEAVTAQVLHRDDADQAPFTKQVANAFAQLNSLQQEYDRLLNPRKEPRHSQLRRTIRASAPQKLVAIGGAGAASMQSQAIPAGAGAAGGTLQQAFDAYAAELQKFRREAANLKGSHRGALLLAIDLLEQGKEVDARDALAELFAHRMNATRDEERELTVGLINRIRGLRKPQRPRSYVTPSHPQGAGLQRSTPLTVEQRQTIISSSTPTTGSAEQVERKVRAAVGAGPRERTGRAETFLSTAELKKADRLKETLVSLLEVISDPKRANERSEQQREITRTLQAIVAQENYRDALSMLNNNPSVYPSDEQSSLKNGLNELVAIFAAQPKSAQPSSTPTTGSAEQVERKVRAASQTVGAGMSSAGTTGQACGTAASYGDDPMQVEGPEFAREVAVARAREQEAARDAAIKTVLHFRKDLPEAEVRKMNIEQLREILQEAMSQRVGQRVIIGAQAVTPS